ncbi:MAG: hypothetical protein ABIV21_05245 [Pyrinomonadaceae bacterium]
MSTGDTAVLNFAVMLSIFGVGLSTAHTPVVNFAAKLSTGHAPLVNFATKLSTGDTPLVNVVVELSTPVTLLPNILRLFLIGLFLLGENEAVTNPNPVVFWF